MDIHNGEKRLIPETGIRKIIIEEKHDENNHIGIEAVYYELTKKWYWPGIKETIASVIRCFENAYSKHETTGGEKLIEKTRRLEKVAVYILKIEDQYVLIGIDYFKSDMDKDVENERKCRDQLDN